MINTQMKLLMSAFIAILIGVVLLQPMADDIEGVKASSYSIGNESVSLTVNTNTFLNESNTLVANVTTLAQNYVTVLTAIRNESADNMLGFCNFTTLNTKTATLKCNETGSATIYVEYTYNSYVTGKLAHDEIVSLDGCRNATMTAVTTNTYCNVTLASGDVRGEYDNFTTGSAYIDYSYDTDQYVRSSAARTLITITILFFAIAILLIGVGFAIAAFKDSGVM